MSGILDRFCSETGVDEDTAQRCLIACNGAFDEALALFNSATTPEELHRMLDSDESRLGRRRPEVQEANWTFYDIVKFPFRFIGTVMAVLIPQMDEASLAREFVREYEHEYGEQHPEFVECSWKDASRLATERSRFLLIYIHAPTHQDTDFFCRYVLNTTEIVEFLNENCVCWGGSIHQTPVYKVCGSVSGSGHILVAMVGERRVPILTIAGHISPENFLRNLTQSIQEEGRTFYAQLEERRRNEADRQLRADQDVEYQRSLEADREQDRINREAAEAQAAEEEAERRRVEQARLEEETEKRRKIERVEAIEQRRLAKQSTLQIEPEQQQDIVRIRVRLPGGSIHTRRFRASDKVQSVYDFVDSLDGLHCWEYTLASSYPKIDFVAETKNKTIAEMGVEHSATIAAAGVHCVCASCIDRRRHSIIV